MKAGAIRIISPGPMATVQDGGRFGYMAWGVPTSGAADALSYRLANLLCGNEETDAAVECTMGGFVAEPDADCWFAITGASAALWLNGEPIRMNTVYNAFKGSKISIGVPSTGVRSYVAFSGGVDVPSVLGSRSTYVKAGLGGFLGRSLAAGDMLQIGLPKGKPTGIRVPDELGTAPMRREQDGSCLLRVTPGTMPERFGKDYLSAIESSAYTVSPVCDRMGIRLKGPKVELHAGADIISGGIEPGAVQVPGSGEPIILMADRQTTGGYTKAFAVISADRPKLGQLRPGDSVKFRIVSVDEAFAEHEAIENSFREMTSMRRAVRRFAMSAGGASYIVEVEEIA